MDGVHVGRAGALLPGGVGSQVGGSLEQDGEHVIQFHRVQLCGEEAVAGVGESVEFQLQLPQAGDGVPGDLAGGDGLHQIRQLVQAQTHLRPGIHRLAGQLGIDLEAEGQDDHRHGQNYENGGYVFLRGGTELQKDEHHGIGKIPFGIELGAVEKYKQKGHGKVQQNTKGQVEGGHVGKEAQ